MQEQRRILLKEFLTPEAKERSKIFIKFWVSRLALVKPENAKRLEDILIQNISAGKVSTKLDETTIIAYIEQLNEMTNKKDVKITIKRKVCEDDDDLGIDENL